MIARSSMSDMVDVQRRVRLDGIAPIMFDRYAGDNDTKLMWTQKVYLIPGTSVLALPTANVVSFLSSHNTNSAPKRLRDAKKYKKIANACLSFAMFSGPPEHPDMLPFMRNGEVIKMGTPGDDRDELSGIYRHCTVARLKGGIPNPKERPVLPLPWYLEFDMTLFKNREIKEQELKNLFEEGGVAIGLGTFRGVFGKFAVSQWE